MYRYACKNYAIFVVDGYNRISRFSWQQETSPEIRHIYQRAPITSSFLGICIVKPRRN